MFNIINIKKRDRKKVILYYKLFLSVIYDVNLIKNRFFDF